MNLEGSENRPLPRIEQFLIPIQAFSMVTY